MMMILNNFGVKLRSVLVIVFGLCIINATYSQEKHTQTLNQVWLAYFNQTRFSNKWGLWADFHLRTKEDFFTNFSQSVIRLGLTYYLSDDAKLTVGYAYVSHYPEDNHPGVTQPEHRPWQQIQWNTQYSRLRTRQWLRLEEKFKRKILNDSTLASGYNFNYKIRYNFSLQAPLSKKGFDPHTLAFVVNDEVHINFGKQIVYNYFDQNRFFVGLGYQTNAHDQLQVGYMNVFQQLASGHQYKSINAARVFYFHNLDLRKKRA
jgi:uncharacterized protein DUF2490